MWDRITRFFLGSETIFLARIQTILGIVATIITYVDPSILAGVLPSEWFPWFLLIHGVMLEYLRRRRDPALAERRDTEPDWGVD